MTGRPLDYNFPKIRFCRRGHAIVGANAMVRRKGVDCRTCGKVTAKNSTKAGNVGEQIIRRVFAELHAGEAMASITGRRGGRYIGNCIINNSRLDAFCDKNPRIGKIIREMSAQNAVAQRTTRRVLIVASPAIVRSSGSIMDEIRAAVPQHLPRDLRDDAIQNIWLAVTERRLKRSEIPTRAHEFVRDEYKSNHNAWGPRSLDGPLWIDSNTTLLDTLASGTSGLWD